MTGRGSVSGFEGSPLRQEIGLGKARKVLQLEVWWPASGIRQQFPQVQLDRLVQITEGNENLEILSLPRSQAG